MNFFIINYEKVYCSLPRFYEIKVVSQDSNLHPSVSFLATLYPLSYNNYTHYTAPILKKFIISFADVIPYAVASRAFICSCCCCCGRGLLWVHLDLDACDTNIALLS